MSREGDAELDFRGCLRLYKAHKGKGIPEEEPALHSRGKKHCTFGLSKWFTTVWKGISGQEAVKVV